MNRPLGLAILALALVPALARAGDSYEEAKKEYEKRSDRPPLGRRKTVFWSLAETKDPRALRILASRYASPKDPKEHERYLIAKICGDNFGGPEHREALWEFAQKHRSDADAWLWFQALRPAAKGAGMERVRAVALDAATGPFLRAAALEALAASGDDATLAVVPEILAGKLPPDRVGRSVLVESCAAVLLSRKRSAKSPEFRKAAEALVAQLEAKETPERTRLVVARHLAKAYGIAKVTLRAGDWLQVLDWQEVKDVPGETTQGGPRFFGVEATGRRVAFLVDFSDSMLAPLTREEIAAAKAADAADDSGDTDGDADAVDWLQVRSRFDLARVHLVRSLRGLRPDVSFLVVGFGDLAVPLKATPGLVAASPRAVKDAVAEIEAIEPGSPTAKRPHGTLRGDTNLHGAFLRAFHARGRDVVKANAHVDAKAFEDGCDTVFLFSDGEPSEDDFAASDMYEGGEVTVDTETGERGRQEGPFRTRFFGPYVNAWGVEADVRRLELFRKVEIHCVCLGEADSGLLQRIAAMGIGRYVRLGEPPAAPK